MRIATVVILAVLLSFTVEAIAHGNSYRDPPGGELPPWLKEPKDPQPPPRDPSEPTPPPYATPPPPPELAVPPREPGAPLPTAANLPDWSKWWRANGSAFMDLEHIRGKAGAPAETEPLFPEAYRKMIAEGLREAALNTELPDGVRAASAIALARCRRPGDDEVLLGLIGPDQPGAVREEAALALGIYGKSLPRIRGALISLADDTSIPDCTRGIALLSLGLLGEWSAELGTCISRRLHGGESGEDLPVCALIAMGLAGGPDQAAVLSSWLTAGKLGETPVSDLVRSWIAWSMGRIEEPSVLDTLIAQYRKSGPLTRGSIAIALGRVGGASTESVGAAIAALTRILQWEPDEAARSFALIALGRIGAARGLKSECRIPLRHSRESHIRTGRIRPFLLIGLGILGRGGKDHAAYLASLVKPLLVEAEKAGREAGGEALACGLLEDDRPETRKALLDLLTDESRSTKTRGAAALALGMIKAWEAAGPIADAAKPAKDREFLCDLATAACRLGSEDLVKELVDRVNDPKATIPDLNSLCLALGATATPHASAPLLVLLGPDDAESPFPTVTRALAAVGLGRLMDRHPRALFQLTVDTNYCASVPILDMVRSIP